MNRRDFVTKLLGVSVVAVAGEQCLEKTTLAPKKATNASLSSHSSGLKLSRATQATYLDVETGKLGYYGDNAVHNLREMYQEQLSREMAARIDALAFRSFTNG